MSPLLLALADPIPNEQALALSPTIGWLMLAAALVLGAIFTIERETWLRLWLRAEDPRALGAFRIVFGLCTLANINGLWELFHYLFTDEGLFFTDVARQVFAAAQFEGFADGIAEGEPYGFLGWGGFVQFLKGPKYSLLFFWDSPTAWWIHFTAFELATISFIVGFKTRWTKWITLFLFHSIILRNQVFWEGTENVYRCFLLYLCLSRCGHAYSIDNWLRCRKLRREGRLSERDGPGGGAGLAPSAAYPSGLEAIYRLVPAWPRMLMILQTAALYCSTGSVKNGAVWAKGDAFYYALNLDHFYRFEPQQLSAIFGTNLFRVMTWVTHYWEAFFPVVVVGLVIRFRIREKIPRVQGWRRWLERALWLAFGLLCLAVVVVAMPVHWPAKTPPGMMTLAEVTQLIVMCWLGVMLVIAASWPLLNGASIFGRRLPRWLNLENVTTWLMGRRLWLGLGVIFHSHLMVMMNIGWFTPGTVATYVAFLNGSEIAHVLRQIGQRLARLKVPGIPAHVARGEPITPPEDPTLPHLHRDAAELPAAAIVGALAATVVGALIALPREVVDEAGKLVQRPGVHFAITASLIFAGLATVGFFAARRRGEEQLSTIDPYTGKARRPWAYGPCGRFLAGALVVYQIVGVATQLLPDKDSLGAWREKVGETFKWWLRTSQTNQGWKMFAPNPPRSNLFMKVQVTDVDGQVYDLNTDVYHPDQKPIPWLFYTRQRKINRRVVGAEGGAGAWYQKWHARWVCRDWALHNGGVEPKKVELIKVWYSIPTPEWVAEHGPYVPEERLAAENKNHKNEKVVYTAICVDEPNGQLPDEIRARHGLPLLPPERPFKAWHKDRVKKWAQKKAELKAKGRDPDRVPIGPILTAVALILFFWRWRRLDQENKAAAAKR